MGTARSEPILARVVWRMRLAHPVMEVGDPFSVREDASAAKRAMKVRASSRLRRWKRLALVARAFRAGREWSIDGRAPAGPFGNMFS